MGKTPDERRLRDAGAEVLERLRKRPPKTRISKSQKARLLVQLGTSPENVDELLSIETED